MIIDRRQGSYGLLSPLRRYGVPAKLGDLEVRLPDGRKSAADCAFQGNGPDGTLRIGVEVKQVSELLGMSGDHRFVTRQIPALLTTYDRVYLVIEGRVDCHRKSGLLMVNGRLAGFGRVKYLYATYAKSLMTLREQASLTVVETATFDATVAWLHAAYTWWAEEWDAHKSLLRVTQAMPISAIMERVTPVRKIAAQIPDIGWKRSKVAEAEFDTVYAMVAATEAQWAALVTTTKRGTKVQIGHIRAARIVAWLNDPQRRERAQWKVRGSVGVRRRIR